MFHKLADPLMKSIRAERASSPTVTALNTKAQAATSRLVGREGALSVDGLDAAVRAIGVATVTLLSATGYGVAVSKGLGVEDRANPMLVASALVLYNLLVILVAGVPWRRPPGFPLFVLDWAVASAAILLTGGFFSPFIILYYALAIGAALRVGLQRSLILVALCVGVYLAVSIGSTGPVEAIKLPILVVQITSLVMVMLTAVAMKRALEVEARHVELEEQAAGQLRLLNNLTNTVLSASPDLERVMRTVAAASSQAVGADSGLAVLVAGEPLPVEESVDAHNGRLLIVADRDPNPPQLSEGEERLLRECVATQTPVLYHEGSLGTSPRNAMLGYPGLERDGSLVGEVACVPFCLSGGVIGALFVGRYSHRPFSEGEVGLLTAIAQQMAVAVRLARLYDMEREKAVRSQESERLERDLLSMVSHELRTPLTAIKTCVGALAGVEEEKGTHDSTQTKLLNNIDRSTDRLINLVSELLDMARLRAGRISLQTQQLNMGEVITELAPQVRPLLLAGRQTLALDLPACGSPRWEKLTAPADRRRIEQVLLNLLANAIKYGPEGGTITCGATPRGGEVTVFVCDEGPGIAEAERERIFEKFYQGSTAQVVAGRHESLGLGLAIARSIVELHGGQIGVHSRLGRGSTFFFTLPHGE